MYVIFVSADVFVQKKMLKKRKNKEKTISAELPTW